MKENETFIWRGIHNTDHSILSFNLSAHKFTVAKSILLIYNHFILASTEVTPVI